MKPVCDAFLDFKYLLPHLFLKLWLSLLLNMQKNKKKYGIAESEETRKNKKIIFNSKIEFLRGHSFMASAKKSKFQTPTNLFPSMHRHPILI